MKVKLITQSYLLYVFRRDFRMSMHDFIDLGEIFVFHVVLADEDYVTGGDYARIYL